MSEVPNRSQDSRPGSAGPDSDSAGADGLPGEGADGLAGADGLPGEGGDGLAGEGGDGLAGEGGDGLAGRDGLAGVGPDGPQGDPHAWYQQGLELLSRGSPAAAAQILQRAVAAEPGSRSVREALARAQFDARRYTEAAGNFRLIVEASPADDYAHFGLGLSLARSGDPASAAEHLALAAAMRPDAQHYTNALLAVRATLHSRPAGRTERTGAEAGTTESREDD